MSGLVTSFTGFRGGLTEYSFRERASPREHSALVLNSGLATCSEKALVADSAPRAIRKGIGYQTLLKMLVHEGLQREWRAYPKLQKMLRLLGEMLE